ncbi:adenosylmethionine--8-amino-7-oxononanoate transaminase [Sphingobium sp. DEHP117]|uniref:adenosylmethionine--8-amino-7-oxononanoate transaminase n=1 Tax=Sphingobium sp. DEHP117 TaxID=2993436 RepID=UPI0027D5D4E2|nr:adenosylmethionine--8-amino-7-oxononanoate transaminase [Sphingobium sp. DEHP117]MDQ4421783.1 adenosylmethionine--8-amino-7-oxononanoate transaminase [Sphingobium sp. DEHP117]
MLPGKVGTGFPIRKHGNETNSPVWHPFTQHGLNEPIPLVSRAEGALLHCADGTTLIDAISSWWVITHGHCDPRIVNAIQAQAATLDQLIFAGYTHEPAEDVARGLIRLTQATLPSPDPLAHVFFSDSGSTAVEVALKMALGYWHNIGAARHKIIVMEHSYHGDTIGAMSVGARGVFNRAYAPLLFDVETIPYPAAGREQATLDTLEGLCTAPEKPAALIVEPLILGAGGMLVYAADMLRGIAEICATHDVLFIADEVMTGWGRTGTVFACEQAGVTPDILCAAKGLTGGSIPLAATLARSKIFEAHRSEDRATMFYHSSSFTANPIACAAAAANIAIWENEDVRGRVAALGADMAAQLDRLAAHPALENPRQLGTITAIDMRVNEKAGYLSDIAPQLRAFCLERGVLLRPLGNTIYAMPPYCTSADQIGTIFDAIAEAADRLGA